MWQTYDIILFPLTFLLIKWLGFKGIPVILGLLVLRNIRLIITALVSGAQNLWRIISRNKWKVINTAVVIGFVLLLVIFKAEGFPIIGTIIALAIAIKTQKWEIIFITVAVWIGVGLVWLLSKSDGVFQIPIAAAIVFGVPCAIYVAYDKLGQFIRWFKSITGRKK